MSEDIIRNAAVAVGTSAVQVAPQLVSGQRTALTFINTSTGGQIITIQWGQQGTATGQGIVLYPAGSWSESYDGYFTPSNLDVWAVGSAASGTLAIQERVSTRQLRI